MKNTSGRMAVMLALTLGLLANVFYSAGASAKKEKIQFPFITSVTSGITQVNGMDSFAGSVRVEFRDIWVDDTILNEPCDSCLINFHFLGYATRLDTQPINKWMALGGIQTLVAYRNNLKTIRDSLPYVAQRIKSEYAVAPAIYAGYFYSNVCAAFILGTSYQKLVPDMHVVSPGDTDTNPGSCVQAPPMNVPTCQFKDKSLAFDFGSLSKSTASGASREKDFTVSCTDDTSFTVNMLTGGKSLNLSNGMEATFSVAGSDVGSTLKGKSGDNTLKMKATLSGAPDADGAFSGSTVMTIGYL